MKISVIIPAAGASTRFGAKDKLAEELGGRSLLLRTVEFFTKREEVVEIIVTAPPKGIEVFKEKYGPSLSFHGVRIIKGGEKGRWESVAKAVQSVSSDVDRIAVHDAARPCLTNELFSRLLLASRELDAVAAAIPIAGTVKRISKETKTVGDDDAIADSILGSATQATVTGYLVSETVDRSTLWELQTPQIFETSLLIRAYEQSDIADCTDDAQIVEKFGGQVYLVESDSRNIKVTTQQDLQLVKAVLGVKGERPRPTHKRF